nr:MAG TPA: hypothetical protein [Caudoviricetes sp.]
MQIMLAAAATLLYHLPRRVGVLYRAALVSLA